MNLNDSKVDKPYEYLYDDSNLWLILLYQNQSNKQWFPMQTNSLAIFSQTSHSPYLASIGPAWALAYNAWMDIVLCEPLFVESVPFVVKP